ncbi:homoserine kinase [Thermoplasma volcanium]|nr:homoserine kinase [Thermoplasma volcanium]
MELSVISPCSSANLGPGYDVLAIAFDAFYDQVNVMLSDKLRILADEIPVQPDKNTAGLTALKMIEDFGIKDGIKISIKKGIPYGLGLGSSGSSAAAAAYAINNLFALGLERKDLIKYAAVGELASSGSPHPDNVSASILGGLVIVSPEGISAKRIEVSDQFKFLLVIADLKIRDKTKYARSLVPSGVSMGDHKRNTSRVASLIAGLMSGDRELVSTGMNDDIVEAAREPIFPYYRRVKDTAIESGAVGAVVSGAGPSILVVYDNKTETKQMIRKISRIYEGMGISVNFATPNVADGVREVANPLAD